MRNRDFRISADSRQDMTFFEPVFETDEDLKKMYKQAQKVAMLYNKKHDDQVSAARVNISAVLHLIYQTVISNFLKGSDANPFSRITALAEKNESAADVLYFYNKKFPTELEQDHTSIREGVQEETARAFFVHQVFQANPALLVAMKKMLDQSGMNFPEGTKALRAMMSSYLQASGKPGFESFEEDDLFAILTKPARLYPDSLPAQIEYILKAWADFLPEDLRHLLIKALDYVKEEDHPHGFVGGGPADVQLPYFDSKDIESFTADRNWMPNVVMMAKSTLVWLDQLSKKYKTDIHRLDQIPDQELDFLRDAGFTALWLIGLWERSPASKKIKNLCGNPDAESSAYSLKGYEISSRLGGWSALSNLRERCWARGIRLASDMVPNHTGLDSDWLYNHSEYFMQQDYPPFPNYTYNGPDLSIDPSVEIKIEDHYYNRTDAAVTFMKRDKRTGQTTYIFHGNDGTTMPWNDTAQLDYLNPVTREAVIQQIMEVARNFPIIRFDAAMTLAKKHIQRLWYPRPGQGGDIAGRTDHEMTDEEFNRLLPEEFWREVVDRIQKELPDTLLLAEAFWMMEGYFVRTLGMHRVYNSAFMHMMKNEDNKKYRDSIKQTLVFDPEILKRYVNFMNNPDEETAIVQFGNSDKYFGVCTMLSTMPGLPMFGHGQLEGFREKYGMEYQRAYWDESPDQGLLDQHRQKIYPLLHMRRLFSECQNFQLFDVINNNGEVQESIYAFSNGDDNQMTLVLYNNRYEHAEGTIFNSAEKVYRNGEEKYTKTVTIAESFRLTRSPRRFMISRNFNDGLYYIAPSMKIFEEGFYVSLNGYQTSIYTEIHEVEDINGTWQKLYERLQGRGVRDIELEVKLMALQPLYEAVEGMKNQKFEKQLKAILTGKGSSAARVEVLQTLATCYTYMEEFTSTYDQLDLRFHRMKPSQTVEYVKKLEDVCKNSILADGNIIIQDDLVKIMSAAFMVMPFVEEDASFEDVDKVCRALLLDHFFEYNPEILARCAFIVAKQNKTLGELLDDRYFLYLIGSNEYQGVRWFKGEYCCECIYMYFLAKALKEKGKLNLKQYQTDISTWIKKCSNAAYKVDGLR